MKDLSEGKVSRLIFNFALPMLIGNIFHLMYNVVDRIIVGNYINKQALAAVGASFPIIFTLISLVIGISMGSTIVISQYFGAKDIDRVKRTIDTLNIFLLFASVTVAIVGISFSEPIFRLIKLPEDIIPQAVMYLDVYLYGTIAFFGFYGTSAILRGLGDSKTPLVFMVIASVCNIGLDLLFIVIFKMGVEGAALGTIISQGAVFIAAIIYLNRTHKIIRFSLINVKFDRDIFGKSFRIGLPTGIQQASVAIGMIVIFWIVNTFGTDVVAAFSVAGSLDSFAALPAMNFGAALSTFVGQNLGANKPKRVKTGLYSTLGMTSIISLAVTCIVLLFSEQLMDLFTDDAEVIRIGSEYLVIVSMFYLIFSTMFVINGVMRGAGDTFIPMLITIFSLWVVRIPLSYFLSDAIGEKGIWWSMPIAWFTGMALSFIYYKTGRWKTKVVVKHEEIEMIGPETIVE